MADELARMRERLATRVIAAHRIGGERVAAALRAVPRHLFLPGQRPEAAYRDEAIVTKRDETGQPVSSSSQPAMMAIMADQLDLAPGQRVLEIGAGTGYNAALISHIVGPSGQVTSVDIDPELVAAAREHLVRAGFGDVTVACADGAGGYPERAPYDRVIATVGVSDLAPAWLEQAVPLSAHEPRSCQLNEERPSGRRGASGGRLTGAPLRAAGWQSALGILDASGLADLAARVRAWDQAGRPGIAGLHVDAYPRSPAPGSAGGPRLPGDALVMERAGTRFAVYHD